MPVVHLHGARGVRLTPAHELLRRKHWVIAFEMLGFNHLYRIFPSEQEAVSSFREASGRKPRASA